MKVGVSSTLAPSSFQKLGSQPKFADSSSGLNCVGAEPASRVRPV